MKYVDHKNNTAWWHAKIGDAHPRQVAGLAREFQHADGGAFCVAVTEGISWIACDHVRHVVAATRTEGAAAVWVSDGTFAQVVWRK